jgi:hypothetical protein
MSLRILSLEIISFTGIFILNTPADPTTEDYRHLHEQPPVRSEQPAY